MRIFRKKKKKNNKTSLEEKYGMSMLYIIKRLIKYVGAQNRKYIPPLIILILTNILFSWFSPLIFRYLIDQGLGADILSGSGGNLEIIITAGIFYFLVTILSVLTRIGQGYIVQKLATITMYNLRYELFVKFQFLGLDYHDDPEKTAGKKISYLTNDVNSLQQLVQSGLLAVVGNFFLVFGALAFMLFLSIQLTLVIFIIIPILFIAGGFLFGKARKYFKELRERVSSVTSELDESIMGMRTIQSFAVEEYNYEEFNEATLDEKETSLKSAKLFAVIPGFVILVITIGLGTLFLVAGILIRDNIITIGTLVAFIFYMFQFFEPLIALIGFFTLLQNSIAAGARIITILDEDPSIQDNPDSIVLKSIKGEIVFKDVEFYYDESQPVLEDINVRIREQERLALVGYTGAGKSTFIKLLSRFYDPIKGDIIIDGNNLREVKIEALRNKMGIVLQDNFLFSGSIKENINYGKLDATDDEIIKAAKKVNAHQFIVQLEDGYDTIVGERGSNLSEGQRQLISFARALISNPPILILDEATSAIDPYSELLVQKALETLLRNRTSISIAHRLSTIINSDRILVMDRGKIIEEGSHKELIEKNGFYKHLYDMQFKDPFKKEEIEYEEISIEDLREDIYDKDDRFSGLI
ncbi:MAG: ATP-binding cassette domain-containing protein [Candidatus Lokiarchaeota archaeon]|nr:ATP-binding cassette domain-containing protein [Candidatus Lokiarchaeota archaeon]MBD3199377.1 ATP-binding cassette domain-containing protein [Candidatus Lokiarchaeota archaeon]